MEIQTCIKKVLLLWNHFALTSFFGLHVNINFFSVYTRDCQRYTAIAHGSLCVCGPGLTLHVFVLYCLLYKGVSTRQRQGEGVQTWLPVPKISYAVYAMAIQRLRQDSSIHCQYIYNTISLIVGLHFSKAEKRVDDYCDCDEYSSDCGSTNDDKAGCLSRPTEHKP